MPEQHGAPDSIASEMAAIERWLSVHAPDLLPLLNPSATSEQIAAFEGAYGVRLPPSLARLYRLHDGESPESNGIFGCTRLLPLAEAGDLMKLEGMGGKIPFLQSGGGDLHCVRSHDPAKVDASIYEWWHEQPKREDVAAPSLEAFLTSFREAIERGEYVYEPDELMALIHRDEL